MKAAFVTNPSEITIKETELPQLGPGDMLVEMASCGICGSDVEKVFGKYGKPSMRLGHEPAGTVLAAGPDVDDFGPGDRVFTHHHVPCYSCHLCTHGAETMCPKYSQTNLSPCGLSQQYVVPEWNVRHGGVLHLPDSVSFEEAAMIEPLACCIRSWTKLPVQKGDTAAVFGVGPTGMLHVMLAKTLGCRDVFGIDVNDFRLRFAGSFGAETFDASENTGEQILSRTGGRGVDLAIVATGSLAALQDAIELVRSAGTVMMFGVPSRGARIDLDMSRVYSKEITLATSYAASDSDTKKALEMIRSKSIDVGGLITHRYALSESQKAFDHARDGTDAMKIIITE